jgi:hypothetical protein
VYLVKKTRKRVQKSLQMRILVLENKCALYVRYVGIFHNL